MSKITKADYAELRQLIVDAYGKHREFQHAVGTLSTWFAPRLRGTTLDNLGLPPGAFRAAAWLLSVATTNPDPPIPEVDDLLGPRS